MLASVTADTLRAHVRMLAGEIGERNVFRPSALRAAADFIAAEWQAQGYPVAAQTYEVHGIACANLEVTRSGTRTPSEIIIVGAHYDSVAGSPGADDNGSGVAALLEMSRCFAGALPERTVRFVAFVNEEPPFFSTRRMGSDVYARAARARGDDIRLMMSLETIGYHREEPASQRYPPLFSRFYPERGNFIAFVANLASRKRLRQAVEAFRAHSDFPVEALATFGLIPGVAWSDHRSFWRQAYRALMVTDTAFYRYPHYHMPEDTPVFRLVASDYDGTIAPIATDPARAEANRDSLVALKSLAACCPRTTSGSWGRFGPGNASCERGRPSSATAATSACRAPEGGFHLCTSWLIEAHALTGQWKNAQMLFGQYIGVIEPPYPLSEEYDPIQRQALGNYPQTYSHVGPINAALRTAKAE